jgi:hypothetical protein
MLGSPEHSTIEFVAPKEEEDNVDLNSLADNWVQSVGVYESSGF